MFSQHRFLEAINITINLGDSLDICLDDTSLEGNVTGIEVFCENISAGTIISDINNVDLCLQTTAIKLGVDTICAVICDNFFRCDTTYYIFTVVSPPSTLVATPDLDSTSINNPIHINVLENDIFSNGILTDIEIIFPHGLPTNGTTTIQLDKTIEYSPNLGFCGSQDKFQYRICTDTGCDTAEVAIFVACPKLFAEDLTIYTGISPNGDGLNDYFIIDGIAKFPKNEIFIFNSSGTKIFRQKGYNNTWNGTRNKTPLPEGIYFYILLDGVGKKYSGYIQIKP